MPTDIVEVATKGTTLTVPTGTDKRKASSLTAFEQAVGDRLKFLENFFDALTGVVAGPLDFLDNATWRVADGKVLKIKGDTDLAQTGIFDLTLVWTKFAGATYGYFVTVGNTGRVPTKYRRRTATTTFFPIREDYINCSPSGSMNLQLDNADSAEYTLGDRCTIVLSSNETLNIKDSSGTTQATLTTAGSWRELIYEPGALGAFDGGWYIARAHTE